MSTLEIVLYVVMGTIITAYVIYSIYRIKHPKKKKDKNNEED